MTIRRRNVSRKPKGKCQQEKKLVIPVEPLEPATEGKGRSQEPMVLEKQSGQTGYIPVALALETLAEEYVEGKEGEALCRAAVRLAEESGIIADYRAKWDALQDDPAGSISIYLFDRRQSLELIGYHQSKGNKEALTREKNKLRTIEGRLLLSQSSPLKVTSEDLEILEEFIRENGF